VTLGSDIIAALPELRRQAESTFTDTYTVYRPNGGTTTDPVTLEERPDFDVLAADVRGKFKSGIGRGEDTAIPGVIAVVSSLEWHTSVSTVGVSLNDEIACTAVDAVVGDASNVGVRVRVTGPFLMSKATARRYPVEEVS
jgi:hypothetical protein